MRCFCEQEIPNRRCEDPEKYKHVHIEYYGNKGSHLLVHNYTKTVTENWIIEAPSVGTIVTYLETKA